jgi:hypothetical protein
MMEFWDSSAVVPLLVAEPVTASRLAQLAGGADMLVWWATPVECISALQRLGRERAISDAGLAAALERLRELESAWVEIEPAPMVRVQAERLLRIHPLRGADAFQLAAALVAAGHDPAGMRFLTGDRRLAEAAAKEGFALS